MAKDLFQLQSDYKPAGDQPTAIKTTVDAFNNWEDAVTLLWATGTGKTFTMANVIQQLQKPTLVISHNKTLAAQLATEFKHFFPNNAVHYFVSYFDHYQPESYVPSKDLYIEKEATINEEIQMYRLAAMASLIDRKDVIIIASASALYGLWQKEFFVDNSIKLEVWQSYDFKELKKMLIKIQYQPVQSKIEPWMFDFKGEMLDIFSSTDRVVYRVIFDENEIERIMILDSDTFNNKWSINKTTIRPATQYIQDVWDLPTIIANIEDEMKLRVSEFEKAWMLLEAERIKKRTMYDMRMIAETWFVNGIENYSPYFDSRMPWETPYTIFEYFPDDFLCIVDESHMTLPQLKAMPSADRARKVNLIKHGFRLPSAIDHRPLRFGELSYIMKWTKTYSRHKSAAELKAEKRLAKLHLQQEKNFTDANERKIEDMEEPTLSEADIFRDIPGKDWVIPTPLDNQLSSLKQKRKNKPKTLFVSATPAAYEMWLTKTVAEQIIRPTWLLDPVTHVYPKSWKYDILLKSIDRLLQKKPHVQEFFNGYKGVDESEVFGKHETKEKKINIKNDTKKKIKEETE